MVIAKKNHRDRIARSIDYIGSLDTTISGSRNGHTPLLLWYMISKLGVGGLKKRTMDCLEVASYAEAALRRIEPRVWRNPSALTVNIPKPDEALIKKWQLASGKDWAHIICMPGMKKTQIDTFIRDLELYKNTECSLAD
jgi:histidine decarboxylase